MSAQDAAPPDDLAAALAHQRAGDAAAALDALRRLACRPPDFRTWTAADRLLGRLDAGSADAWARRTARVAVLSSHTGAQLTSAVRVASLAHGLRAVTWESGYGRYEQDVLDPASDLYRSEPEVVLVVVDHRELRLPDSSEDPAADVAAEVGRWQGLWQQLRERTGAVVVQTTFVPPPDDALGEAGATLPGGRRRLVREVNAALAEAAPVGVHLVDAETVAGEVGLRTWFDERYWLTSKHAVGLGAVGLLAVRLVDVAAAALGLSRKVVVLDLDGTLWGGVVGEDGVAGLVLGDGPAGEAFVAFQRYAASLRSRGLVLAVCSKNDADLARLPFTEHPEMRLGLDDLVAFEASWGTKPDALRRIAADLGLGLDALVLVDDNPAERERVRHELPEVGVVELPAEPSGYVRALSQFPGLQSAGVTLEDARRTEQYRARAAVKDLQATARSPEDFLAALGTTATVEDLSPAGLPRMVQLVGKTNQLNLTGRRHQAADLERLAATPGAVVWGLRVRDRFDDHGLVAVLVAQPEGDALAVDTFVMSCRVLGRTVEQAFLAALADHAREHGHRRVVGTYVPSGRNTPSAQVLPDAGFVRADDPAATGGVPGTEVWELVLDRDEVRRPEHVRLVSAGSPATV